MTSRRWIPAIIACWGLVANAPAQPAPSTAITGVYNGTFSDAQGPRTLKLALQTSGPGTLTGVFTLYLPPTSHEQAYSYSVGGSFDAASGKFNVRPLRWLTPPPERFRMVGLAGTFEPGTERIAGTINGGRGTFEATRDPAESANIASIIAPPKAAEAAQPVPPTAAPTAPSPAKTPAPATATAGVAAPLAASRQPAPAPDPSGPTAINGVYTGTFQRSDGNKKLKLSIKSTDDGALTGLFTFDLPGHAGSSVTYKLTGRYVAGAHDYGLQSSPFQFTTVEPMGSLALDPFDAAKVQAVHVGLTSPGSIAGSLTGSTPGAGLTNLGWIRATRDQAESADLDGVMAAQLRAASVVSPNAPAAMVARLSSIDGVYNGTFTSGPGSPTKFKLTITQTGHGNLAGVFTVYLPTESGTKAYTYSLEGGNDPTHHRFQLMPREWDTVPPRNFETMPLDGTFLPDVSQNTARILSWQMPAPRFGPRFEATWDATESADLKGAIAAQKAVGPPRVPPPTAEEVAAQAAAQATAVAAHADALKNAPPAQLASKDLVRKSQAYWAAYQTDMIRQVFDGGFGSEVDEDGQFRALFCTYVEMFSKNCRAYLPAKRESVTITQFTRKPDGNGGFIRVAGASATIEVDSRFAAKYRQFAESAGSSAQNAGTAVGVMTGRLSTRDVLGEMLALASDMERFFATETGPSAAMRQLGENFLRGATGERSLQEAGAKIDGAEVETDKGLPPGRFARFVDGANAFYRDPANARYRSSHDTAFCQLLAQKYQNVMTREEEYYYANDFGPRFRNQIMQPKQYCTDPAWPRLHPAVEECIAEIQ